MCPNAGYIDQVVFGDARQRGKVPEQSACGAKSNPSVMTVMRLTRSDD
jgi:hypothetical protein